MLCVKLLTELIPQFHPDLAHLVLALAVKGLRRVGERTQCSARTHFPNLVTATFGKCVPQETYTPCPILALNIVTFIRILDIFTKPTS